MKPFFRLILSVSLAAWVSTVRGGVQPLKDSEVADHRLGSLATLPNVPPKSSQVSRKDLPLVFRKDMPESIADLKSIEQHVKSLVAKVSPAVVAVEVGDGSGSGVVISPDGLVMSAGHVCGVPDREVRLTFPDGKNVHGKTLGIDEDTDAGLIKITDAGPWPCVNMGDLAMARIGDWVLALGHPGGFDLKRSLVVRLGRIIRLAPESVQTDCTISPGDSGGPLFDMHGRVVGIHSFISSSTSDNFHVPVTAYYSGWAGLVDVARTSKHAPPVPEGYAGAEVVDNNNSPGCRVTAIEKHGPAFKAGLKEGDIIVKVEGRNIMVSASFQRWVIESRPGKTLNLEVKRGNKLLSFRLKLDAQPHSN